MADTFKGNRRPPWGRRVLIALVVLVLSLVPAYFLWTASLERRFDAQIAALRASGEPIDPEDFNTAGLADDENGVIDLRRAWTTLEKSEAWKPLANTPSQLPLADEQLTMIRAAVAENSSVFDDLAKAAAKPGADWNLTFRRPVISTLLPEINHQNNLAWFLRAAALEAHLRGDDAAAVERVRHMLVQSRLVGHHPMTTGHFMSLGVASTASDAVEQISPDLRVGGADGASPEQVRALIDELLDDAPARASFRRGLRGERMAQVETVRGINDGSVPLGSLIAGGGPGRPLIPLSLKPLVLRDGLIMLEHSTAALAAADAPDLQAYTATAPPAPPWMQGGGGFGHAVARAMMPASGQTAQTFYRGLAERRLMASVLAIRWYASEHEGRRPATLAELVPRYLPDVPRDALAAGGKPLLYRPDGEPPSVYSVGPDGRDNNGSTNATNRRQSQDLVIPLDRPKTTTEPVVEEAMAP